MCTLIEVIFYCGRCSRRMSWLDRGPDFTRCKSGCYSGIHKQELKKWWDIGGRCSAACRRENPY